jgi:hypothetical protein
MSFDGSIQLPALDAITVIACLGNYPLESTTVKFTRTGMQLSKGWVRYADGQTNVESTQCLKCACLARVRDPNSDGREEFLHAVLNGWIIVHGFAPKSDLFKCACRILPDQRPRARGTWAKPTHQF